MAYKRYKRFRARKTRKVFRYSRGGFRRRYRRYYRRYKRNRRFPKSTECKCVEIRTSTSWQFDANGTDAIAFSPGRVTIIPSPNHGVDIVQGTSGTQRIGNKITPVKLRITGALSFDRDYGAIQTDNIPMSFHVRLLIYQVRGGNGDKAPYDADYHPLAMETVNGMIGANMISRLLDYYSYTNGTNASFTVDQIRDNMGAAKCPLRLGIGGQFKMLYTKTFNLSNTKNASYPFRIVTKVPNRLVWPERTENTTKKDKETKPSVRNAVYITWICTPQSVAPKGDIHLNYNSQLFFIDK